MKNIFILILLFCISSIYAQSTRINPHGRFDNAKESSITLSNDTTYDVKFYHLDLEIGIDEKYIKGSVEYIFTSNIDSLNSIVLDLDAAYIIDSVSLPAIEYKFENNRLEIKFSKNYSFGESFAFKVYYSGKPELQGGIKGLVYKKHSGNQPIIASLSTPYLAHKWWPCKDGTFDKPDSVFVDITIKDTLIADIPVIAISNGVLDTIIYQNGMKTFKWEHRYPIVPYYVMVAISNYRHYQQSYNENGLSFPLDYYVFDSDLESAKKGVVDMPKAIKYFSEIFGTYPFSKEKYGMTQLGFYGAIENQTNTIINNMSEGWFYTSVHELAHQWFADMITCNTWHHGWLNEGFASYAEALYAEYVGGFESYKNYMSYFKYFNDGTIYMDDVSNPFNVFRGIIYNKGAYVLHMLRGVMGDADFFKAIKKYALDQKFQYGAATTEDFQKVCELVSGMELDYFFEQWIYDERYPVYYYNYYRDNVNGNLKVYLNQRQGNMGWRRIFNMPIDIQIIYKDGSDTIFNVVNDEEFQIFTFINLKDIAEVLIDPKDKILKKLYFDSNLTIVNNIGVDEKVYIYPNPNRGIFSILIDDNVKSENIDISIVDINNNLVFNKIKVPTLGNRISIELNSLKSGVYFVRIKSKKYQIVKKILIAD